MAQTSVFAHSDIQNLPRSIAAGLVKDAVTGSTVAQLSGTEPMRFGETDIITFNDQPKAEFVGEADEKSPTKGSFGFVTAKPHKAQVTMRFNQEVQWADQDYQLGVLSELASAGSTALSRALDLGLYYRINPLTGSTTTFPNYLDQTTKRVDVSSDPELDIESAVGLLVADQKSVNGIAFDPSYAWKLATLRYTDGRKKFPELGYGVSISNFQSLPASTSNTVSAQPEASDNGVRAIVGDFQSGIRWGVQRNFPLEVITYGDPDGQGDLKRRNQIALRLEIVYGWYVFTDRFTVIENGGGS